MNTCNIIIFFVLFIIVIYLCCNGNKKASYGGCKECGCACETCECYKGIRCNCCERCSTCCHKK